MNFMKLNLNIYEHGVVSIRVSSAKEKLLLFDCLNFNVVYFPTSAIIL